MTEQDEPRPELIIALVCPLGARIEVLQSAIHKEMERYGYVCENIHVSELLASFPCWEAQADGEPDEHARIKHRQDQAFQVRRTFGEAALARAAIGAIRDKRRALSGDPDKPAGSRAYILRQLKHPEEVRLLRNVYGQSLLVIAGHAPEALREKNLMDTLSQADGRLPNLEYESKAKKLIHDDAKQVFEIEGEEKFGQNTRDTYPLADVFVSLAGPDATDVARFLQLVFGHPSHTPSPEEMAMHQASAVALRSSDERRQVGAVVVARTPGEKLLVADADIVASGTNEVPRRLGGLYWEGESPDGRDHATAKSGPLREDTIKNDAVLEIASRLKRAGWLEPTRANLGDTPLRNELVTLLKGTQVMAIGEFMRQVHAEMAAIVDAARRGVALRGCEMYVTTFPCHNCAKHIIAAGIVKVVYLEPYPKSRAEMLHKEEIALDPVDIKIEAGKVIFVPFTGVAPRQYPRLFSMSLRGSKNGYSLDAWNAKAKTLAPVQLMANSDGAYTKSERDQMNLLSALTV